MSETGIESSYRTVEEACGHGARLHVPRNRIGGACQWVFGAAVNVGVVVFSIAALVAVIILALNLMDIVLSWI